MLSVNISFTGLANVLIAGMASISNRFNTAYYTTYRRVSGERRRLSDHAFRPPPAIRPGSDSPSRPQSRPPMIP